MTESGNRHRFGFKDRTRVADALDALREVVTAHGRTEAVAPEAADGRVLAEGVAAERNVPHYERAAMDGYAVRAADTFGASDRSPAVLQRRDADGAVESGAAVRVHTGSALPDGADAVVMVERLDERESTVEVFDAVAAGENVGRVGEDVAAGQRLYDPGHRLRPSDLGLLRSAGVREVTVADRPEVAVLPTGDELVPPAGPPAPGLVVETNGLTVSRLAERWGAETRYRDVVPDEEAALRDALARDADADVLVTTGGSSVGERDVVPETIAGLGEVVVHGVALKPGHPVALGRVEGTPVVALPGYPVSCIVTAVQFLRPAVAWSAGADAPALPGIAATLERKLASEPGVRTFARVRLEEREGTTYADPVSSGGAGVLSSVALADGWVAVPERSEGVAASETVTVEYWE